MSEKDSEEMQMYRWYLHQKESWDGLFKKLNELERKVADFSSTDNYTNIDLNCCVNCTFVQKQLKQGNYNRWYLDQYYCYHRHGPVSPTGICTRYLREGPTE